VIAVTRKKIAISQKTNGGNNGRVRMACDAAAKAKTTMPAAKLSGIASTISHGLIFRGGAIGVRLENSLPSRIAPNASAETNFSRSSGDTKTPPAHLFRK
jgi:hypothetical protein